MRRSRIGLPASVLALVLLLTAAAASPERASGSAARLPLRSAPDGSELFGLSGEQLFGRLGVPTGGGDYSPDLETWIFGDDALQVTLICDQIVRTHGALPEDFVPAPRPGSGRFVGQTIGAAVRVSGSPTEIHTSSRSVVVRFEDGTEALVVGPRGRLLF